MVSSGMVYCVQCGKPVGSGDRFCAHCGATQGNPSRAAAWWDGLSPRTAMLLCYIPWAGWIASVAILATQRFRNDQRVRFHAFQGLYMFAAWILLDWATSIMFPIRGFPGAISGLFHLAMFIAWIVVLSKVAQGQDFRVPVLADLADRSNAANYI